MSRFFHFRPNQGDSGLSAQQIIFSSADNFSASELRDIHTADVAAHGAPGAMIFLVRADRHKTWLADITKLLRNGSEWRIDPSSIPIIVAAYDERGGFAQAAPAGDRPLAIGPGEFDLIKEAGLRHIFITRDGLLTATGNTHFVHPSRKHSLAFVRTANLLVDGNETNFIAMCLLKHVEPEIEYLWVDTSSIASLAHAAVGLRMSMDRKFRLPVISSFSSWDAVTTSFTFPTTDRQLLVISASTSGSMARDLERKTGIARNRIVTLFSLAQASELVELANLHGSFDQSIAISSSESDAACKYCDAGWTRIEFLGDQFLADSIRYEPVDIVVNRESAAQRPLTRFMTQYHGLEILKLGAAQGAETTNDFHVDVDGLLAKSPEFRDLVAQALTRHIPAGPKAFIHDMAQGMFTSTIGIALRADCAVGLTAMTYAELARGGIERDATCASVVVIAQAIASGASLERISRDLRQPFDDRARTYIIGVSKHAHLARTERTRRNLRWSNAQFDHVVVELEKLSLPQQQGLSAWQAEVQLLRAILNSRGETEDSAGAGDIGQRLAELRLLAGPSANGFFWPAQDRSRLSLNPTFAFFDPVREVSEADVLYTIAWALELMRSGQHPKLVRTTGHQAVIAPSMFDRFNDGIIQAALLRNAHPHELFFAANPDLSAEMARILERTMMAAEPGSTEFLISLACGRLRIMPGDLERVLDAAAALVDPAPALINWMREVPAEKLSMFGRG